MLWMKTKLSIQLPGYNYVIDDIVLLMGTISYIMLSEKMDINISMHGKNVEFGNLIPRKFLLLEGNICNFEGKCTI